MLRRPRPDEWLFAAAVVAAIGFWFLALTGRLSLSPSAVQGGAQHAADKSNHSGPLTDFWDWLTKDSISFFTAVLAGFTGALVWVALLEINYLKRANKTARKLSKIAKRQLTIQGAQTDLMVQQKEIARQQFLATHRPKLRIRHITRRLRDGEPITIHCTVTNIGETNARVIGQNLTVAVYPIGAQGKQSTIRLSVRGLAGGQSDVFLTERGTTFTYSQEWNLDQPHGGPMFIRGALVYVDDSGIQRRIGFLRRYNCQTDRFDLIETGEDEYED